MRLHLSILSFSFLLFAAAKGQSSENIKQVQQKILSADSIVLISHVLTVEFAPKIVEDWDKTQKRPRTGKTRYPKYLKNGKINPVIIKQRKILSTTEITELSQILKIEKVEERKSFRCDWPHHSILIYKKNILSYIDICLDCQHVNTSEDIALADEDFSENKWEKLKLFFKKHGLTYELD
jgi:hypothetical protein